MKLDRSNTALIVVDVQEKLMPVIDDAAATVENIVRLIRGCQILGIPVLLTEQYVKGLGGTVSPVRQALEESGSYAPVEKMCFSAQRCVPFERQLADSGRRQVLVCGVETHVCVYQTVSDLLAGGFEVSIVADAVSSRTERNREIALQRMVLEGTRLSSTEMALFELLGVSGTEEFKAVSRLVK